MNVTKIIRNQSGTTLYVVIMILAILTLLGVTLIDMTVVDLKISKSHVDYKKQLYLAESAAIEGMQRLTSADLSDTSSPDLFWIHSEGTTGIEADSSILSEKLWKRSKFSNEIQSHAEVVYSARENRKLSVVDLSRTNLHEYEITGIYNPLGTMGKGRVIVKIGYRKRF